MNQLRKNWLMLFLAVGVISGGGLIAKTFQNQAGTSVKKEENPTLNIMVGIAPQAYFVQKIVGNGVQVNVMVEPGAEPDNYEPKPKQLQELSKADAYITVGVPFETAWMNKIKGANSDIVMIDSTKGIKRMEMIAHLHQEDHHRAETLDPHIWLSPQLVKIQAKNIYQGLSQLAPENKKKYQHNLDQFIQEIDQLNEKIKQNLAEIKSRKFIVFHPAWGYFARDYNLTQIPVEVGGQEPSAAELGELIQTAKAENIQVVFAQPELTSKSANTIAKEIGGKVIFISPLSSDWSNNLLKVSETLAEVLKQSNY
jgi:zinc transport system substrate-binding protein